MLNDALQYTVSTPIHILQQATKQYGTITDYSTTDNNVGSDIICYYLELSGAYCYLYDNQTTNAIFHHMCEFELDNLQLHNESQDTKKIVFDLQPGQKHFILVKEIDSNKTNKMAMRTDYSITINQ